MRLKDKIAIVTGAGSGFGEAIAKLYAEEGARVCVADIRGEAAERVAREIGSAAVAATGDVSKAAGIETIVSVCRNAFGEADVVVNNSGDTHRNQPMLDVDAETIDRGDAANGRGTALQSVPTSHARLAQD